MENGCLNRNFDVSLPRYEELLLPSKFFYNDCHEAATYDFLDETKVDPQVEYKSCRECLGSDCAQYPSSMSDELSQITVSAALDMECALDAACGNWNFLVILSPNLFLLSIINEVNFSQIELMDEFCTTIEERLSRIIDLFESSKITDCLQLLANLQDASSALGFRSLFSAATETHEAIAASQAADSRVITASLSSNIQKAKEAWAAARAVHNDVPTSVALAAAD